MGAAAFFDVLEDGIPCTFADGPKKGHIGVVDYGRDGLPVPHLEFGDGLIYRRGRRRTVNGNDAHMQPRAYRGIEYKMDPACPFAKEVEQALDTAKIERQIQR